MQEGKSPFGSVFGPLCFVVGILECWSNSRLVVITLIGIQL